MAEDWRNLAACKDLGTEPFVVEGKGRNDEARTLCAGCSVRLQCLEEQMAYEGHKDLYDRDRMIHGGMDHRERYALWRRRIENKRSLALSESAN